MNPRLVRAISFAGFHAGIIHVFTRLWGLRQDKFVILNYHRVNDDRNPFSIEAVPCMVFEAQMAYLARHYHVRPLDEVLNDIREARPLRHNTVVLTFDDGYRDNYTHAFPILRRFRLPATIFLATGCIGTGELLWFDRVLLGFKKTTQKAVSINGQLLHLDGPVARRKAAHHALEYLKILLDQERGHGLGSLWDELGTPSLEEADGMMLTWEEVRSMANQGVTFGAHTVSHPILSTLSPEKARDEIVGSKRAIESKTGNDATLFAYPNGKVSDYSPQVMALVKEAGFRGAVTTEFGCNGSNTNVLELCRMRPWEADLEAFALRLAAMSFRRPQ